MSDALLCLRQSEASDTPQTPVRARFAKLSPVFGPAIVDLLISRRSYLRPYAYINVQESWAVGVEAFFENHVALRDTMPALYSVIAEILKQDPASVITAANQ